MPADLALLTGPDVEDLLAAAVATVDGRLLSWAARHVDHRPGRGTTVSYRTRVAFPDGDRELWMGASTRRPPDGADRPGMLSLSDGTRTVSVWCWPQDPWLPALPAAREGATAEQLLRRLGAPPGEVRVRVRAYRPGRRAVLELTAPRAHAFVKVLRPGRVSALHDRHVLLFDAGLPVPRSLGWDDNGVLALAALPGTPMRQRLRERGAVPGGIALLDLLDRLPEQTLDLPRRPSWTDNATYYAGVVGAALPDSAGRAQDLAGSVLAGLAQTSSDPEPTHGDLYEAQLLLDGDAVSGVLDVDTAGPGRRADDLACLLAHLLVLADMEPGHGAATRALAERWRADFERRVDPVELRLRTAGVLLSLATGPHRVQERGWQEATRRRLDLVAEAVRAASRVSERPLTSLSSRPHVRRTSSRHEAPTGAAATGGAP